MRSTKEDFDRILVVALGPLGEVVQAFAGAPVIRAAHPDARITLVTLAAFAGLARASGLFDEVEADDHPGSWLADLKTWSRLRTQGFGRVYDLQLSGGARRHVYALLPHAEWPGAQEPADLHNLDRIAGRLHAAGIAPARAAGLGPAPDLAWVSALEGHSSHQVLDRFDLTAPLALLAPGPVHDDRHRTSWPLLSYTALAWRLTELGLRVAMVGDDSEAAVCAAIAEEIPSVANLAGRASLLDLAVLGASASLAVGGDNGLTHLLAYAGAPGLMLMSKTTAPERSAPRARMDWLKRDSLADLSEEKVFAACRPLVEAAMAPQAAAG